MKQYKTIKQISGPLIFVERTEPIGFDNLVRIQLGDGQIKNGQVLDTSDTMVVVQIFEGTSGIDRNCKVNFLAEPIKLPVAKDMLGRIFNGSGRPLDGGPQIIPEKKMDIIGSAINPYARSQPCDFIQTGISTIDMMNTLVRGQKLPIFSGSGLPHNELALQIARQSKVLADEGKFVVIFAAMGITHEEAQRFIRDFEDTGAISRSVVFLNLADDPAVERLVTPRMALTTAEYFAYEHDAHVLVILTDLSNYCESLREIGAAREEVPGRRGYPGYMYTDLATIYERAGIIKGRKGSVTQIPILTMHGDDITHPIPDLTGYITEGQIVLSRELHRKAIYPPIDVLPSLSRLMNQGISKTREDHKQLSDQTYANYAEGRDLRGLAAIVGEEALAERDRKLLEFADRFEKTFVNQSKNEDRDILTSLEIGWGLCNQISKRLLTRISPKLKDKYWKGDSHK